jgi:hypothetical protein
VQSREELDRVGRERADDDVGSAGAVVVSGGDGLTAGSPDHAGRRGGASARAVDGVEVRGVTWDAFEDRVQDGAHPVPQGDQVLGRWARAFATFREPSRQLVEPRSC